MILVDTSIWIDHLRDENAVLTSLLRAGRVMAHPFVVGEIAMGTFRQRDRILAELQALPQAIVVTDREALHFIGRHRLFGRGVGYVDTHLLAAVRLTLGASLWTRDMRLHAIAEQLGLASAHTR